MQVEQSKNLDQQFCEHGNFLFSCPECKERGRDIILRIADRRSVPDTEQVEKVRNHIEKVVLGALSMFVSRFETYCRKGNELEIVIVDATDQDFGSGEVKGTTIDIPLLEEERMSFILQRMVEKSDDITKKQLENIGIAITCSTILHEAIHSFLESKPHSSLHEKIEAMSSIPDPEGIFSTLCDEAIAYSMQSIFSETIEPFGNTAPRVDQDKEASLVAVRKKLGMAIEKDMRKVLYGRLDTESFFDILIQKAKTLTQ